MSKHFVDREMEARIKNCSKIANKVARYIQKEVKVLSAQGESDPFLVQDMSIAYTFAIIKVMFYRAMKENEHACEWNDLKDGAHKAIDIAFQHAEDQFIKNVKIEVSA
jgi:hypothetical protein